MISKIHSAAFIGIHALPVEIEVDITGAEELNFVMVGLPDTAVKEAKDRVNAAIRNSNLRLPPCHCTINLAPADLKKEGSLYDLPIAIGLLQSLKLVPIHVDLNDYLFIGELSLSGELRPIKGALLASMLAKKLMKKGIILPLANAKEASLMDDIDIIGVKDLKEVLSYLNNPHLFQPIKQDPVTINDDETIVDFSDIKGQEHVKRALEIAAAGQHNLLLFGPPGCGKTMMAKALIGIMPSFTTDEVLQTTQIHSIAGLLKEQSLVTKRPFRAPHHTISYAGLIGGGAHPKPGEVSLAHGGILFLDELPEFSRHTLEVLREPLENKEVSISRACGKLTFPASFLFVAAMNPCPCGLQGHPTKTCKDSSVQVARYKSKISGPLLDRIDMHVEVPMVNLQALKTNESSLSSKVIKERVVKARNEQLKRAQKVNGLLSAKDLKQFCGLDDESDELLKNAADNLGLSLRAHDKILRVSRTIADLEGSENIMAQHLMEALQFRNSF